MHDQGFSNVVVFSTDDIPDRDRDTFVRDFYGRIQMGVELEPHEDHALRMSASTLILPTMACTIGSAAPVKWERMQHLLSDGIDDICLSWGAGGYRIDRPGHETIETVPGSAALLHFDRRFSALAKNVEWTMAVQVKRTVLSDRIRNLDDLPPNALDPLRPESRLLFDYLWSLTHLPSPGTLASVASRHIADLLVLSLGRPSESGLEARGVRAARLASVKRHIADNLRSSLLSAETASRKLGISSRYIRKLFAEEGTSFSDYVTRERLAYVHARLRDRQHDLRQIAAIAYDVGFAEPSTFYRQFKACYGMTPNEVRDVVVVSRNER
ncbi:MAG: helix-turn-helix protein [Microvirga sp.]|jgi:AraC-like DNA-binding protein|nr:helix-turn-helix protein [Microvirga sp.]